MLLSFNTGGSCFHLAWSGKLFFIHTVDNFFYCWSYLAYAVGVKRGRGRQSPHGRRGTSKFNTSIQKSIPYLWPKWPKSIRYLWPKWLKNPIFCGCTYLYSPYKGVPPPGNQYVKYVPYNGTLGISPSSCCCFVFCWF